jgi:hypothetical protein
MTEILKRHDGVRDLFDNRWLHLFALDATGRMAWRYNGDLTWVEMPGVEMEVVDLGGHPPVFRPVAAARRNGRGRRRELG